MTKKFKYINKSGSKQAIIGVGEVESNKVIESDRKINNPNFTMVGVDPVTKPKNKKVKKDK